MFMMKEQFYPEKILKRIMEPDFMNQISDGDIYKLGPGYLDIDYCIELAHPNYDGPRVRKDVLSYLLKVNIGQLLLYQNFILKYIFSSTKNSFFSILEHKEKKQ